MYTPDVSIRFQYLMSLYLAQSCNSDCSPELSAILAVGAKAVKGLHTHDGIRRDNNPFVLTELPRFASVLECISYDLESTQQRRQIRFACILDVRAHLGVLVDGVNASHLNVRAGVCYAGSFVSKGTVCNHSEGRSSLLEPCM